MSSNNKIEFSTSSHVVRRDISYYLLQYWRDYGDKRTNGFPLMAHPWFTLAIMSLYLVFVLNVGPKMMKNRKAYQLRVPMFVYNTVMVVLNAYFFFKAIQWLDYGRELFNFQWPDGNDRSERTMSHIWYFYLYWLTKLIDLLDTIFFVLRKKDSQISGLHLYHHTTVPLLGWLFFWNKYGSPGVTLFAFLNSIVHVIMYSYYALSAFGPRIQKYLSWKRYITQIQIIQFTILVIYSCFIFGYQQGYPPLAFWLCVGQPPLFIALFGRFYLRSYLSKRREKVE